MSSYIYMKILESRPSRYDRGIAWLSFGQAYRTKQKIVREMVHPGMKALDIGCGTGTLTVLEAREGAEVLGFDISPGMLEVARRKITEAGLADRVELREMGVTGMDGLGKEAYDLVTLTLVLSELSPEERRYVLRHAFRVLKPGGRLAVTDEARPESFLGRLLHLLLRIPLSVITFALTQTTTRPVRGLRELVQEVGFRIEREELSGPGSFCYLVGGKEARR